MCGKYVLEEKKDFTEQLNELSTKQHQRQYSGLNQFNVFHSRSSSVEPQQQNNDEETIQQIHKEEDILEKSRQILEQSQIKNQQLAEQVDTFLSFLFFSIVSSLCRLKFFNEHYKEMKFIRH